MSNDYKQLIIWQKADLICRLYIERFHDGKHPKTHLYHIPLNTGRMLAKQLSQILRRVAEANTWSETRDCLHLAIACLRQLENVFDEELFFIFESLCDEFPAYFREFRSLLLEMCDAVEMRVLNS